MGESKPDFGSGVEAGRRFARAQEQLISSRQAMLALQQQTGRAEAGPDRRPGSKSSHPSFNPLQLIAPVRVAARVAGKVASKGFGFIRSARAADYIRLSKVLTRPTALKTWAKSLKAIEIVRASDLFDPSWYLKSYPAVARSGMDPARHYVMIGAGLGYRPSAQFDTRWYLQQYPDVAKAQVNPLQHYVLHGEKSGRHPSPSQRRLSREKLSEQSGNTGGLARIEQSNAWRINHIAEFEQRVADYHTARQKRSNQTLRVAVYSAAIGPDERVLQPAEINPEFDYWCFTDRWHADVGIWQFAPLPYRAANDERARRFVKTHPHHLLPDYDVVIWVDSGVQLHGTLAETLRRFQVSEKPLGALANQIWPSVFDEADNCLHKYPDEAAAIKEQVATLESAGYAHDDLIDTAWLFIDLRHERSRHLMDAWWCSIDRYSFCDQLSINPVLDSAGLQWHRLADNNTGVADQPALAVASPALERPTTEALEAALSCAGVDSLPAPSFAPHRELATVAAKDKQIDIVLYVTPERYNVAQYLESIVKTLPESGVQLLIVENGCLSATLNVLRDFCERHDWAKLLTCEPGTGRAAALNSGLAASTGDLVIILDAQVTVAPYWVEKMAHAVFSTPGAGLVGPVTNAAVTQNVVEAGPAHWQSGLSQLPPGVGVAELDRHCEQWAELEAPARAAVVSGFCLGITREVLSTIGGFDEQNFPAGARHDYDYSLRASDAGFGIVIACNTFVFQRLSPGNGALLAVQAIADGTRALERLHGEGRVARVSMTLERNLSIDRLAQQVIVLDRCQRAELPTVCVLPSISGRGVLSSSAYIRLVLPLALAGVASRNDIDLLGYWDRNLPVPGSAKIAYLQRELDDVAIDHIQAWSQAWKDAGGKVFFDIDDDLFDTEGLMERTRANADRARTTQERIRSILECTDVVTASTPELAERLEGMCETIVVMPNHLDAQLWRLPAISRCETPRHSDGAIRIGYIGTATHQQDLEIIVAAVQRISKHYGAKVQLEVVGAFEGREVLFGRSLDLQGASEYPAFVDWAVDNVSWDIGLIPLVDDTFNRSKSDLKFTEYAALGMAIVCSDVPSYRSVAVHDQNSLVVPNEEQAWYEAIAKLVEDAVLRKRLAVSAHEFVCEHRTMQGNEARVVDLLARGLST